MIGVLRGQWAKRDKRVIKETKECQDWSDLKENKVQPDHQAQQVQKVQLGLEVL